MMKQFYFILFVFILLLTIGVFIYFFRPVNESKADVVQVSKEIDELSIFHLTSKWRTQDNETVELIDFRGKVIVVVMIFTSCQAVCPRLVTDIRNISEKIDNPEMMRYLFISIDPINDVPKKLKEFAKQNNMDTEPFFFLNGSESDVREFSQVVSVKYKKTSPIEFVHSSIISVFDQNGVLHYQKKGLQSDNKEIVKEIKKIL